MRNQNRPDRMFTNVNPTGVKPSQRPHTKPCLWRPSANPRGSHAVPLILAWHVTVLTFGHTCAPLPEDRECTRLLLWEIHFCSHRQQVINSVSRRQSQRPPFIKRTSTIITAARSFPHTDRCLSIWPPAYGATKSHARSHLVYASLKSARVCVTASSVRTEKRYLHQIVVTQYLFRKTDRGQGFIVR